MTAEARPAVARRLLRASKRAGQDAARSPEQAGWQRTERAVSRSLGRLGHWTDARNPDGMRRVAGGGKWWLAGVAGALLVWVAVVVGRRRGTA